MRNKVYESFLLLLFSTVVLAVLSFTRTEYKVQELTTKRIHLFDEVLETGVAKHEPVLEKALSDSLYIAKNKLIALRNLNPASIVEFKEDSTDGLYKYFEALNKLRRGKKKVRVAYFGDSMIEGDLITQDLRKLLQEEYGGEGVGFVPVTSIVAGFRQTIVHSFSRDWNIYNLLDPVSEKHTLGISGYVFEPSYYTTASSELDGSWVRYRSVNKKRLSTFNKVKLYHGASIEGNMVYCNNDVKPLQGSSKVNEVVLNENGPVESIQANFVCKSPLNVYGFSFESDTGIYVDNFSFRGNSGMPLTKIPKNVLSGLNDYLEYDLVVLHYGVNVVNSSLRDYSWYKEGMRSVVEHFKDCFPNASLLVISTGDKSKRQNGTYLTDPAIPYVVEAQKQVAKETNTAFWDLYHAMGGPNSMVNWVQGDTVYAAKDYTHFNWRGARKVANMLYKHLSEKHDEHNKKKVKLG